MKRLIRNSNNKVFNFSMYFNLYYKRKSTSIKNKDDIIIRDGTIELGLDLPGEISKEYKENKIKEILEKIKILLNWENMKISFEDYLPPIKNIKLDFIDYYFRIEIETSEEISQEIKELVVDIINRRVKNKLVCEYEVKENINEKEYKSKYEIFISELDYIS